MNKAISARFAAAVVLAMAGSVWAQSASTPAHSDRGAGDMSGMMKSGMERMSQMHMTGDTDKDFALMMKMHHQQAVDMARIEVDQGKSPELKELARKIIKDQQQEIDKLDGWLKKHP